MQQIIAPSILSADFGQLERDIKMLNTSEAEWIHIDVMDGQFVPNISFGIPVMKTISQHSTLIKDVHLMINTPEHFIEKFADAGADLITVHYEACSHVHRIIQQIKTTGAKAGIAINPHTNILLLEDVLEELDLVLVMSVNPGFGGQKFIYRTLDKIRKLDTIRVERNLSFLIEVDGGVGLQNARAILQAGANVLVAGSSVFKSDDPIETIHQLNNIEY